jgi:hypothetical protein
MSIGDANSVSLKNLSRAQRHALANLLNARSLYMEKGIELNRLRLKAIANPTEENEEAVRDFAALVTTPLREDDIRQAAALIRESIQTKELLEFLPSVLMGLLQFVNLPLLLTAIGVEPNEADRFIELVSEYIKKGSA